MLKITTSPTYNIRGTLSLLSLGIFSLFPNSCLNFVVKMAISKLNNKGERISPCFTPRTELMGGSI